MSFMEGIAYNEAKPIKDFSEGKERAKQGFKAFFSDVEAKTSSTLKAAEEADIGSKIKGFWSKVTGKKDENNTEEVEPLSLLPDGEVDLE